MNADRNFEFVQILIEIVLIIFLTIWKIDCKYSKANIDGVEIAKTSLPTELDILHGACALARIVW